MSGMTGEKRSPPEEREPAGQMRLNRFLARAGIASRRRSDELIASGAVQVNGAVVDEPGRRIDVDRDRIEYQGCRVRLPSGYEYLALHKPAGCLVSRGDTHGRPTVFEQIPNLHPGTVAVGRLDMDTTGLLLLTDDGELAYRLMHPRYRIDKRYEALVYGHPQEADLERLRNGIELEDGRTAPARVSMSDARSPRETRLIITIHEGRKRQVRRMCMAIGHRVRSLKRIAFADLELDLPHPGQWRHLSAAEVEELRRQVGIEAAESTGERVRDG